MSFSASVVSLFLSGTRRATQKVFWLSPQMQMFSTMGQVFRMDSTLPRETYSPN